MPSRREFIGSMLATAVVGGCSGKKGHKGHKEPAKAAPKKVTLAKKDEAPVTVDADLLRELTKPPVYIPRDDTLAGIRQIKAPGAELIEVAGDRPDEMVKLGMRAIGGVKLFVSPGDRVVISPNFAWARPPGSGATTDPELVRAVIQLCWAAGAREVVCLDYASDMTPRAFKVCGAYKATEGTRARLISPWSSEQFIRVDDFKKGKIHAGKKIGWQAVASVLMRCDVFINMPIFKHHREVGVTGALKKLMGCVWRRSTYHAVDLDGCIAELAAVLRPTLTIMDGTRILTTNGPNGPGKVATVNRMVLSVDPLLADAYACRWLEKDPLKIKHLVRAAKLGVGKIDVSKGMIETVKI